MDVGDHGQARGFLDAGQPVHALAQAGAPEALSRSAVGLVPRTFEHRRQADGGGRLFHGVGRIQGQSIIFQGAGPGQNKVLAAQSVVQRKVGHGRPQRKGGAVRGQL